MKVDEKLLEKARNSPAHLAFDDLIKFVEQPGWKHSEYERQSSHLTGTGERNAEASRRDGDNRETGEPMTIEKLPPYTYEWIRCTESADIEARCVELPDLSAYGETPEEALDEIKTAVSSWLEVLERDGLPFPAPLHALKAS